MTIERWGTLSVKDHLSAEVLAIDLLLYDRLVFPVFSGPGERTRWRGENWDPELQEALIEKLGTELTVRAPWDETRRQQYEDLRRTRKEISEDAFQMTRRVLAMDQYLPQPPGVTGVRAVAAYHDLEEGTKELEITPHDPSEIVQGKLAFVIGQRLLVPVIDRKNPEKDIQLAAELSRNHQYRKQRSEFYAWQEATAYAIVEKRKTIEEAVAEMQKYIKQLNRSIAAKWEGLALRTVATVVGAAIPYALELQNWEIVGAIPGAIELVKLGAQELTAPQNELKCEVAAMIVTARKTLGY